MTIEEADKVLKELSIIDERDHYLPDETAALRHRLVPTRPLNEIVIIDTPGDYCGSILIIGSHAFVLYKFLRTHWRGDMLSILRNAEPTDNALTYCRDFLVILNRLDPPSNHIGPSGRMFRSDYATWPGGIDTPVFGIRRIV